MSPTQYKVVRCEKCNNLVYKRTKYKTSRCPICNKQLLGNVIEYFDNVRSAIAFIKEEKLKNSPQGDDIFETFG